jgi:probable blue pigment (indigoidine) exporter
VAKQKAFFMKNFLLGLGFAMLWASASVANKFGLEGNQPPLWMTNLRFMIAAALLLFIVHGIQRAALPKSGEWKPLLIYGVLNNTFYMSLFIYGLKGASPGISTLTLAINPVLISILSSIFLKKEIKKNTWIGLTLGSLGIVVATYPLLKNAYISLEGMLFLGASMLCYSIATIYYTSQTWVLPKLSINAWQIFFGAICMLPITFLFNDIGTTIYSTQFCLSVLWLVVIVTMIAVQFWLNLLSIDAVKASFWLFTCPIFGFLYANIFVGEPITVFTMTGTILVISGLYIHQKGA